MFTYMDLYSTQTDLVLITGDILTAVTTSAAFYMCRCKEPTTRKNTDGAEGGWSSVGATAAALYLFSGCWMCVCL